MNSHCTDLSIYLGHACNFNCSYCDRGYIRNSIGGQGLSMGDVDSLCSLVLTLAREGSLPPMLSFHGGEPFYYVRFMRFILSRVKHVLKDTLIFIQTNGSLISKNENFFREFSDLDLTVSISYDFAFQGENRTAFDLIEALEVLKAHKVRAQLQYVIPLDNPRCMSLDVVREILGYTTESGLVSKINLIPLRHIRGKDKFQLVLDEVDINSMFFAMLKFVEVLYVLGVKVTIDGHGFGIQKDYFNNHKQIILSPDGKVYPEYDFLEYRMEHASIGSWNSLGIVAHEVDESQLVLPVCRECSQRRVCGLKYLFKAFGRTPRPNKCQEFYKRLTMVTHHVQKLNEKKSLVHWMSEI